MLPNSKRFWDYNRGLFHGIRPTYVERASEFGNKHTTILFPNIHSVPLYSELLNRRILFLTTVQVLRLIDKKGGIDNYLLKTPKKQLDSEVALKWRAFLCAFKEAKQQLAMQPDFLTNAGLPSKEQFLDAGLETGPISSAFFPQSDPLNNIVLRQLASYKAVRPYGFARFLRTKRFKPLKEYLKAYNSVNLD